MMIVQSILLPKKGSPLDVLALKKGLEWLSDARTEKQQEFDRYIRLDQLPVEKFDKNSLALRRVDESGVWVIGGELVEKGEVNVDEKMIALPFQSPMGTPVAEIQQPAYQVTFREALEKELSAFLGILSGTMEQSEMKMSERKAAIMKALDSFGSFLSMSLDAIGSKAVKIDTKVLVGPLQKSDQGGEDMFKTKEEFVAAVKEAFAPLFKESMTVYETEKKAEADKLAKEEEERKKKEEEGKKADPAPSPEIVELKEAVKTLTQKMDKWSQELATDPSKKVEGEETKIAEKKNDSPFAGFFTKKR